MGTPFTPGQFGKLQSVVNIGIATALPKVVEKYDPKAVLKALDGRGEIFAGRIETALQQALDGMLVLASRGATTIVLTERHNPDTFYRNRVGLYVWDDYRTRIVTHAKPSEAGTTFKVERFDLTRGLTDKEIEDALSKVHLFNETQVSGAVAGLIAKQANGEEGELVNNGFANLFYTGSCVVSVGWFAARREWRVGTWERGGRGWFAGSRVFSPGN